MIAIGFNQKKPKEVINQLVLINYVLRYFFKILASGRCWGGLRQMFLMKLLNILEVLYLNWCKFELLHSKDIHPLN